MAEERIATIITGGGRGIGRAVSLRMAKDSAVIVVGRTEADLVAVVLEIREAGGDADFVVGDVQDQKTARSAVAMTAAKGWVLRNLVCNAGMGKSGPAETFDMALWREMFAVNVEGSMHFVQACLPAMRAAGRGTICLMSSIAGLKGYAHTAAYTSSKHALVGLARSLAQEHGKNGIVVVPICPGYVESEMTARSVRGIMERHGIGEAEARERIVRSNPQRRILPAEEVADAVAFVCSGAVPSLSGSPLVLSGGE